MARRSSKVQNESIAEVEDDDEVADEDGEEAAPGKRMSKAGAARATLAEGIDVPRKASAYIKQKYGIDISPQQFSAEKCRLKTRGVDPAHSLKHDLTASKVAIFPSKAQRSSGGEINLLEALETMKPLIEQLGAEKVKRMVDLLG